MVEVASVANGVLAALSRRHVLPARIGVLSFDWKTVCGVFVLATLAIQYWPVLRPRQKPLPPGSSGWPFLLGHSLTLFGDVGGWLRMMHERYGPAFRCIFFGAHVIVVDCDTYDRCLAKLDNTAQLQPLWPSGFQRLLGDNALQFMDGGSTQRGSRHRRVKRKVLDGLSTNELKLFLPRIFEIVQQEFESMEKETLTDGQTCFMPHAYRIVKQVILELVLGAGGIRKDEYLKETSQILLDGMIAFPLDLGYFNAYGRAMNLRRNYCKDVKTQMDLISRTVNHDRVGCDGPCTPNGTLLSNLDLTSKMTVGREQSFMKKHAPVGEITPVGSRTLLGKLTKECQHGEGLNQAEMEDLLISLLFGGSLTTAETMQWLLVELNRHPQWKSKVEQEQAAIAAVHAERGFSSAWESINPESTKSPCPETIAACYETLRLHCPADVLLRSVSEPVDLGGHQGTIPAGWWVAVHLSERGVREGAEFNPARWRGRAAASELHAFGLGPHVCVGRQLALWELQVFLHTWLTDYEIDVIRDDIFHETGLSRFKEGLPVRVRRRTQKGDTA